MITSLLWEQLFPLLAGVMMFWAIYFAMSGKPAVFLGRVEKMYFCLELAFVFFLRSLATGGHVTLAFLNLQELRTVSWAVVVVHLLVITGRQVWGVTRRVWMRRMVVSGDGRGWRRWRG